MIEVQSQSATIADLAHALATVQQNLQPATKDVLNTFLGKKYASLNSCWDSCRQLLAANGFSVVQAGGFGELHYTTEPLHVDATDKQPAHQVLGVRLRVEVVTTLLHQSGEWIRGSQSAMIEKGGGQDVAAAVTYLRRLGLCAIVGISSTDDPAADSQPAYTPKRRPEGSKQGNSGGGGVEPKDIHRLGCKVWGEEAWRAKRNECARAASKNATARISELTQPELEWLLKDLKQVESEKKTHNQG